MEKKTKAKKSLGQHFLRDQTALERIAEAGDIQKGEVVVEIGPGHGELTKKLLERGARVVAIEKDEGLAEKLKQAFEDAVSSKKLTVIADDIQNFSLPEYETQNTRYKLIANIPYYLTGLIIRKFLTANKQPARMVLLIQKEVAERIVARNGKESLLSISVKAYGLPRIDRVIKKGAFSPQPKVNSAVLVIENISRDRFSEVNEKLFFKIARAAFAEKRKQLFSKIKHHFPSINKSMLADCEIHPKARAEEISCTQFFCLAENLSGGKIANYKNKGE